MTTLTQMTRRVLSEREREERINSERAALDRSAEAVRRRCKTLYGFLQEAWPILEPQTKFVGGWAVKAVCDHLEAVTRGDIRKLLINIPPGFAKSLIVAVFWQAWEWGPGGTPWMRFLTSSYEESLAIRDNTRLRRLVESEWYQDLWPITFARDQNEKRKFENTDTGGRECRAFLSMTGGRGRRVVIDDPHSVKGADMENQRVATVITFRESVPSRGDGEAATFVVIMQRLHEADVSGVILKEQLGYVHLCLPMEFEPERRCITPIFEDPRSYEGELLAPERVGREEVEVLKKALGPYAYAGQYQQRPSPREGALIKIGMIEIVDAVPAIMVKRARGWDFGASIPKAGSDPDWTVGGRIERDSDDIYYITDVRRFRGPPEEVKRVLKNTTIADGQRVRVRLPQDPGQAGKAQAADFTRMLAGYVVAAVPVTGDKVTRAEPFASQVNAGNVKMLRAAWNEEVLGEMATFPAGTHDDVVDALADAFTEVSEIKSNEGLAEFMRQEAERLKREAEGVREEPEEGGYVKLRPPPGIRSAYGIDGTQYKTDENGVMTVHPDDAAAFGKAAGWARVA